MDHMENMMFGSVYAGKKVLITGHTGFKGSWLTFWLLELGAQVVGVSNNVPSNPSLFLELKLGKKIKDLRLDIRDGDRLFDVINSEKPDFVFHLAAQSIVSKSYKNPIETFSTNVMGTANLLDSLRTIGKPCVAVIITSDKAYRNVEQIWGYRETDTLGGDDPYSGSKGAAELVINSFFKSFFVGQKLVKIGIARAGNVIGGGDWTDDRVVVDTVTAWSKSNPVTLRNPNATRPWQHVLEPVSGYLTLGRKLFEGLCMTGESFNFGPPPSQNQTVRQLIGDLADLFTGSFLDAPYEISVETKFSEATLLKLNCDKAEILLNWYPTLNYRETVAYTAQWYRDFYGGCDPNELTGQQLSEYINLGCERNRDWTV